MIDFKRLLTTNALKEEVVALRQRSYAEKFGRRVQLKGLDWNLHDDESFHFGAIENNVLVSTIRLTRISNEAKFEALMQFPAQDPFSKIPSYTLSRAATLPDKKGRALSMNLRILAYEFLLDRADQNEFLFGTALGDSKRLEFLTAAGYEMKFHSNSWRGFLDSESSKVAIFRIPIGRLLNAAAAIKANIATK